MYMTALDDECGRGLLALVRIGRREYFSIQSLIGVFVLFSSPECARRIVSIPLLAFLPHSFSSLLPQSVTLF